jgi:hypothetical protein
MRSQRCSSCRSGQTRSRIERRVAQRREIRLWPRRRFSFPQSKSAVADFDRFIEWPKPAYTRFRWGRAGKLWQCCAPRPLPTRGLGHLHMFEHPASCESLELCQAIVECNRSWRLMGSVSGPSAELCDDPSGPGESSFAMRIFLKLGVALEVFIDRTALRSVPPLTSAWSCMTRDSRWTSVSGVRAQWA